MRWRRGRGGASEFWVFVVLSQIGWGAARRGKVEGEELRTLSSITGQQLWLDILKQIDADNIFLFVS